MSAALPDKTPATTEPKDHTCAVCLRRLCSPRLLPCTHVFCLECLTTAAAQHRQSISSARKDSASEPPTKRAVPLPLPLPMPSLPSHQHLNLPTGFPLDFIDPSRLTFVRNSNLNINPPFNTGADFDFHHYQNVNATPTTTANIRKRSHADPTNPKSCAQERKDDVYNHAAEGAQFPCPVCRRPTLVPEGGVAAFPEFEWPIQTDSAGLAVEASENRGSGEKLLDPARCVSEDCIMESAFFCKGGCGSLCMDCAGFHRKLKATRSHELVDIRDIDRLKNIIDGILYCEHHPGYVVEFYCQSCSHAPLLCLRCIPFGHNNHKYTDLQTGLTHIKSSTLMNIQETESLIENMHSTAADLIVRNEKVEDSAEEAISNIKEIVQKYVDILKEIEKEVVDQVIEKKSSITDAISRELATARSLAKNLRRGQEKAHALVTSTSPMQILQHGPLLSCLLDTYIERARRMEPSESTVLSFLPYTSVTIRRDDDRSKAKMALGRVQVHSDVRSRPTHARKCAEIGEMKLKAGRRGSGRVEFDHAWGIAANPRSGHVYVADQFNHRIQILSAELEYIGEFGRRGTEAGMFNNPISVCVDPSGGCVVVVDNGNHRLQVFTADGKHVRTIGSDGSQELQFRNPLNVAMAYNGVMFVTDTRTERVQMLTEDGKFLRFVGQRGCGEGEVGSAEGIAITHEDEVCVLARGGNHIHVFDILGDFKRVIPIDPVEGRCSLLAGPENTLWVSDSDNHRVLVYTAAGERVKTIGTGTQGHEDGEFSNQMGIAFGPHGAFYVCDYGNNRVQIF